MIRLPATIFSLALLCLSCGQQSTDADENKTTSQQVNEFRIEHSEETINIFRTDGSEPILTQNAKENFRPYLHPIKSPDGKSVLTEYSPDHHAHQTGLYWGFTRVNERDYFHHPEGGYWKRVSAEVLADKGEEVKWQTVYHLLDEASEPVLRETQTWTMQEKEGKYLLDLVWKGEALTDITIGEY